MLKLNMEIIYTEVLHRMKQYMSDNKCTIRRLAGMVGISETNLSQKLSGTRGLDVNELCRVLEAFPELDAEWLLRGFVLPDSERSSLNNLTRLDVLQEQVSRQETMLDERDKKIRQLEYEIMVLREAAEEYNLKDTI